MYNSSMTNDEIVNLKSSFHVDTSSMPIALIGIGCKYPGINSPRRMWKAILNGENTVDEVPGYRSRFGFDVNSVYDSTPRKPGKIASKHAGMIEGVEMFDPAFFGVSDREAKTFDPQQRLILEQAWHAIEDAGIVPDTLKGSKTGVFIGSIGQHYLSEALKAQSIEAFRASADSYTMTGVALSVVSGRLSYFLGTTGPSVTLDTACSSSLIAIHQACQSIWFGDSDMALAGGVNLLLGPEGNVALSRSGLLSPTGQCKSFGDAPEGFGRSEGVGVVMLCPLSVAIRENYNVYSVILGTASNNDGQDGGHLMAPSHQAQTAAIQSACRRANVSCADIHYVEAHGTGTALGDVVEVTAIHNAVGNAFSEEKPLYISSLKGTTAHTEAAAGVGGLIRASLSLKHQLIPKQPGIDSLNPDIPWIDYGIKVPEEHVDWTAFKGTKIAGINSFGLSGTNAHVIVAEAPIRTKSSRKHTETCLHFPVSGHTERSLLMNLQNLASFIAHEDKLDIEDLSYTLVKRRTHHQCRFCCTARNMNELSQKILDFIEIGVADGVLLADADVSRLYMDGGSIEWPCDHGERSVVSLPPYSFDQQAIWFDQ